MDEELKIKVEDMHMGRLIGILSHQMARNRNNPSIVMESDELTAMQKHVLKFILLETLHRERFRNHECRKQRTSLSCPVQCPFFK